MGTPKFATVYEVKITFIPAPPLTIMAGEKLHKSPEEDKIYVQGNSLNEAMTLAEDYAELVIGNLEDGEGALYEVTSLRTVMQVFLGSEDEIDRALAKLENLEGGKPN